MLELADQLLMEMRLKEHFEGESKEKYILSKEELINFVMKYNKLIQDVEKKVKEKEDNELLQENASI